MKYVIMIHSNPRPWGHPTADYVPEFQSMPQERKDAMHAATALTAAVQRMHTATSPMAMDVTGLPGTDDEDGGQA